VSVFTRIKNCQKSLPRGAECKFDQRRQNTTNKKTINQKGDTMAENKVQDYTEDRNEGHVDTREANFECEKKDENLGCDMGIDVAG
jgi:hypothetical protein